jgi:hypothetical protein
VQTHAHLGEETLPYVAALFVAVLAFMVVDRWRTRRAEGGDPATSERGTWGDPLMAVIAVVVLATSVLSGVWIYRAGHSGATSVWSDLQVDEGGSSGHGGEGGESGG